MRIRGAKTELEEMGEDTDGMVESTAKLRTEIKALTGVDIMESENQFKSTYDILDELSTKWKDLTDIQQASVTELIAGKRQGNIISALMTNFDTARETVEIAMNDAEGSATRELENYQRGVEYSIGQFKAAFQELSTSVITSDFLKGIIDAGTKAIETLTKLVSVFGNLRTAIAGLAIGKVASTFFKGFDSFKAIGNAVSLIGKGGSNNITGIAKALSTLDESAQQSALSILKLSDSEKTAVLAMNGIKTAAAEVGTGTTQMTTGLAGIGTALKGFVTAHPFLTIAAGIGVATTAILTYKKHVEEVKEAQRQAAVQAGNEWKEQTDSIEENLNRVVELRTSIDSGELNDEETLSAKKEILSIQQQIVDLYGSQASGIDLVNGKLQTQLEKVRSITREEAERTKAENLSAFNEAQRQLGKSFNEARGAFGEDFFLGEFETQAEYSQAIRDVLAKYSSKGLFTGESEFMGQLPIYFKGTTEEALDVLGDFMVDLMNIQQDYGFDENNNPLSFLYNNTVSAKQTAEGIVNDYKPVLDLWEQLSIYSDPKKYGFMGNAKTAQEWTDSYTKAVTDLNEALLTGKGVDEAYQNFKSMDDELRGMVSGGAMKQYSSTFEDIRSKLDETALSAYNFKQALTGEGTEEEPKLFSTMRESAKDGSKVFAEMQEEAQNTQVSLEDAFGNKGAFSVGMDGLAKGSEEVNKKLPKTSMSINEAAEALKKLNLTDVDLGNMFIDSGLSEGEEAFNSLINAAEEYGIVTEETADGIQPLIDMLLQWGVISEYVAEEVTASAEEISTAFEDAVTGSQNALSEINNAMSILSSGTTGKSVDASLFDTAEMLGYASALEYVNGTIQVNEEKVRELAKAQSEEQIAANNTAKALKQQEYLDNAKQIETLTQKLREAKTESDKANYQTQIDGLTASNDLIANQCAQLDLYSQALRESTGAYQAWLAAQSAGSEGDMARDVESAMSAIGSVWDTENSEMYQRFGNNKYEAAVEFLVPDSVSAEGQEAVKAYVDNLGTYFGDKAGTDKFIQESIDKQLMEYDPDTKALKIAAGKTMKDFAEGFNWTDEVMQAMFGEMQEFYPQFDLSWADEVNKTFSDLAVNAYEAAESLTSIEGNEDLQINLDVSDLETTEEKVSALDETIQQMNDIKAKPGVDASEIEDANSIIEYCVAQKQKLEAPAIMHLSVEDSGVSAEMQNALSLLQEFQNAQNTVEMQAAVGADTSKAQGEVDSLVSQIEGLSPEIKATLGLSDEISAESITAAIGELTVDAMVEFGVNPDAVTDYKPENKEADVVYGINTDEPDGYQPDNKEADVIFRVNDNAVVNYNPPVKRMQVIAEVVQGAAGGVSGVEGPFSLNGTAHASGTAKASGDWGNKTPGRTLVGELGTEIVVDPHTGKWHTVGDNGAEFVNIPKDAIVFNHLQSKSLLERGFVNGRGSAKASGTAMVTGEMEWDPNATTTTTTPTPDYTAATTAVNNFTQAVDQGTDSVSNNTGSTNDNTKSKKKEKTLAEKLGDLYDWVAVRLEYFGNKTKAIADKINDYISLTSKTALLSKQMDAVAKEINANATGARTYREQADLVATQMEMSNDLVRKARTGEWQFEELSDDDEDKVKTYLKYYDGFQKATEKVRELRNEQLKLFEDWANMPTEKAEKKVEKLTNRIETLSGAYSVVSSGASGLGVYNQVMNADYYSASKAVKSASKKANSADLAYQSASAQAENAENEARSFGNMLQGKASSKKGVPQSVKNKISAAVSSGTVVRLTSKERKSTPASLLKQIDKYNKQVNNGDDLSNQATSAKNARNNANAVLKEAKGNLSDVKSSMTNVQKTALQYSKDNTYVGQNALLDAQVKDQKNVVKAYDTAFKTATENVSKTANKATKAKAKADAAEKKLYDAGQSILSGDVAKNLSSKQKKAIKAGKAVDTRGLTGDTLKAVKEYNKLVTASQRAQENAADATTNYNTALKAQEVASQNLVNAKTEEAQMIIENEKQKFENIKTYYEAELNYQNALTEGYAKDRELKEKQGKDTAVADYTKEINSIQKEQALLQNEKTKLEQQLQESVANGTIKEGSEEWKNMKAQIIGIDTTIDDMSIKVLDLQDEMRNEVFYRALNKALKEAEKLRDALSTIGDIISDDMMFDKDGNITNLGITSLAMNLQGFSSNLGTLETLLQKRQMIIDKYNGGKNDTGYSQKEFDEDMETITGEIQNALKNADSARSTIIGIIAKISKAELDATFKVIDARKKLLQNQKAYYDYDKTLRGKTKDLQLLDQQIAALDGVTDAESRAMKARLEAQREEAREDLEDTVREHTFNLQVDGLDELKTELQENYDNYIHDLNGNLDKIVSAVEGATTSVNSMLGTVTETIKYLLNSYGIKGLTPDVIGLKGYASGTRRAGRNGWALTNERGGEMVITDRGIYMPLSQNSGVVPADLTSKIFGLTENYSAIMGGIGAEYAATNNKANDGSTIAPVINCPITITGNQIDEQGVIRAINKQMPVISRKVQSDIRKDLNKSR